MRPHTDAPLTVQRTCDRCASRRLVGSRFCPGHHKENSEARKRRKADVRAQEFFALKTNIDKADCSGEVRVILNRLLNLIGPK